MKSEFVPVGELRVSADANTELVTVTASCVALVLYDLKRYIGGMLHVVLPGRRKKWRKDEQNAFFADTGVPMLIQEMSKYGAIKEDLVATLAGGATLLTDGDKTDIGIKNVEAIVNLLRKESIPIIRADIGGKEGRRIQLNIRTGEVHITVFETKKQNRANTQELTPKSQEPTPLTYNLSPITPYLIEKLTRLTPNLTWAGKLLEAIHQPDINWTSVRQIISRDMVLSLHIFRIANSPYYGKPRKIGSFNAALNLLGPAQVRRICMLAAIIRQTKRKFDNFGVSKTMLSDHSLATAVIARYLARTYSDIQSLQEDAFTAGMLHGIKGLCIMLLEKATEQNDSSFQYDKNYGSIPKKILSEWKIPVHIIHAVSGYEKPELTSYKEDIVLTNIIHLACGISRLFGITTTLEPSHFNFSGKALKEIGARDNNIINLIPGVFKELQSKQLLRYFGID